VSTVREQVAAYEERLRLAELGSDSAVFEELLADNAVLVEPNGAMSLGKTKVVEAHRPGKGPVFASVQMSNMQILDHGDTAVVTCKGTYVTEGRTMVLKFMRVWLKKQGRWRIIAATVSR
jgi:ketosteroid isomerase-like protein